MSLIKEIYGVPRSIILQELSSVCLPIREVDIQALWIPSTIGVLKLNFDDGSFGTKSKISIRGHSQYHTGEHSSFSKRIRFG